MNSIRPLFTITILAVVAVYLYLKINEGPALPVASNTAPFHETADGVPPLDAIDNPVIEQSADPGFTEQPSEPSEAPEELTPRTLPTVPEIPPLPEPGAAPDDPSVGAGSASTMLPPAEQIPTARYPGESSPGDQPAAESPLISVPAEQALAAAEGAAPSSPDLLPSQPQDQSASTGAVAAPGASEELAAIWPTIEDTLHNKGDLAKALQLLTPWHAKAGLSPADQEKIETLLSQLAGTVVYSTEHRLLPAHEVQSGETLETIAARYNIPWQLLAKINGVPSVDAVRPGQQLKVVPGPFAAVVDLTNNEVSLHLDGRYAGRFPIVVPQELSAKEGPWIVMQKIESTSGAPDRSLLLRPIAPTNDGLILGAAKAESLREDIVGMSPTDANEIADILSVGSRVTIRR